MWCYKPKYIQSAKVPAQIIKDHASQYRSGTMDIDRGRLELGSRPNRCHYTGAVFTSVIARPPF
jgi:hypothetical protein